MSLDLVSDSDTHLDKRIYLEINRDSPRSKIALFDAETGTFYARLRVRHTNTQHLVVVII